MKTEQTIKQLREDLRKTSDPEIKKQIAAKIDALKNNKDVLKHG